MLLKHSGFFSYVNDDGKCIIDLMREGVGVYNSLDDDNQIFVKTTLLNDKRFDTRVSTVLDWEFYVTQGCLSLSFSSNVTLQEAAHELSH